MTTKLGVNIDHIATIREARKADEPDPVHAAVLTELAGAHGITVHLRQDRRHIRERDVLLLQQTIKTRLNVELAATREMIDIVGEIKPHTCTLVPESPEEVTTTGGLDVIQNSHAVTEANHTLTGLGIRVSVFLDPVAAQIQKAFDLGCGVIEINTGPYAEACPADLLDEPDAPGAYELTQIRTAARLARSLGMTVLAGHGLNYRNVTPVADIEEIEELNIGHNIIARASLVGLETAVREMLVLLS